MTLQANAKAACLRIKTCSPAKARYQRRHDMRVGKLPDYVDASRSHLNRCLVSPRPFPEITSEIDSLRANAGCKRKRKTNAAIVMVGVIGFGRDVQPDFCALSEKEQDAAILTLVKTLARRLETLVESVDIHRDESAFHAHFSLRAYNHHGRPLTACLNPSLMSDLQSLTCDILSGFCPMIERGHRKAERLASGAAMADVVHRSVRRLHSDLPIEIAHAEATRDEIVAASDLAARERDAIEAQISDLKMQSEEEKRALAQTEQRVADIEARAKTVQQKSRIMVADFNRVATALSTGRITIDTDGHWQLADMGNHVIDTGVREAMTRPVIKLLRRQQAIDAEWQQTRALRSQLEELLSQPDLDADLRRTGENLLAEPSPPMF
ncbi:MAG: hypothetical protein JJU40_16455 [Rhodobacteraceae bacterium]|nr:hypothetical protein [Paracoccaceae bacterium]